jgi:uncharacterized protein (TIGR00297 family)
VFLLLALAISAVVAGLGWWRRALTADGAAAATAIGTAIVSQTGTTGLAVLGTFFVGSTFVSRVASRIDPASEQSRTEVRDARQVLANGGVAALGAFAEPWVPGLGLWLVTIALAAAGGDTWSTAFGRLSPRPPRDIVTRQPVPAGTSGGVSWFGTTGGLVGATLIGLVAATVSGQWSLYPAATLIGFVAMLADSVLGSRWQARFHCARCGLATERRRHDCGSATDRVGGWGWLDNDAVNATATVFAGVVGVVTWPG